MSLVCAEMPVLTGNQCNVYELFSPASLVACGWVPERGLVRSQRADFQPVRSRQGFLSSGGLMMALVAQSGRAGIALQVAGSNPVVGHRQTAICGRTVKSIGHEGVNPKAKETCLANPAATASVVAEGRSVTFWFTVGTAHRRLFRRKRGCSGVRHQRQAGGFAEPALRAVNVPGDAGKAAVFGRITRSRWLVATDSTDGCRAETPGSG
jgi:hypothetical protein